MADIVATFGDDVADDFVAAFSARLIYVPMKAAPHYKIAREMGEPFLIWLSARYGGAYVLVPLYREFATRAGEERVRALIAANSTALEIARAAGVTQRTAYRYRSRVRAAAEAR